MYPYDLSDSSRKLYEGHIKKSKNVLLDELIKREDIECFTKLAPCLITKNNIDQLIDTTGKQSNRPLSAFFRDYKQNTLRIDPDRTTPPNLQPENTNSYAYIKISFEFTSKYGDGLLVLRYKGFDRSITLPISFSGKPVRWFFPHGDFTTLENIIVPEGYTRITNKNIAYALHPARYKGKLKSVALPDSVTKIDRYAFAYHNKLEEITLGEGIDKIFEYTFSGCTNLRTIRLPSGVTSIDAGAFSGCEKLEKVEIGSSVTAIKKNAFESCPDLVIYAPKDSFGIGFAKKNKIKYVEL